MKTVGISGCSELTINKDITLWLEQSDIKNEIVAGWGLIVLELSALCLADIILIKIKLILVVKFNLSGPWRESRDFCSSDETVMYNYWNNGK